MRLFYLSERLLESWLLVVARILRPTMKRANSRHPDTPPKKNTNDIRENDTLATGQVWGHRQSTGGGGDPQLDDHTEPPTSLL